jgi:uncharacterized protein
LQRSPSDEGRYANLSKENPVTQFAERHPFWFVAILEVMVIVVYLALGTIAHFTNLSNIGLEGIANLVLTIIAVSLLSFMGWWHLVGFRPPDQPTDLLYFIVPFLPAVISLVAGVELKNVLVVTQLLIITLMIGFAEEAIFRGLMLNALKPRGDWTAAIVTSSLFALSHSLNVLSGKNLADVVVQILYALAIGFAFAALVLRKGIIWPLVLAHFLIDFTAMIGEADFSPVLNSVLGVAITFALGSYGLFVMLQKPTVKVIPVMT